MQSVYKKTTYMRPEKSTICCGFYVRPPLYIVCYAASHRICILFDFLGGQWYIIAVQRERGQHSGNGGGFFENSILSALVLIGYLKKCMPLLEKACPADTVRPHGLTMGSLNTCSLKIEYRTMLYSGSESQRWESANEIQLTAIGMLRTLPEENGRGDTGAQGRIKAMSE